MGTNDKVIQTVIKHSQLMDRGARRASRWSKWYMCQFCWVVRRWTLALINSPKIFSPDKESCVRRSQLLWIVYIRRNKCLYFMSGYEHDLRPFIWNFINRRKVEWQKLRSGTHGVSCCCSSGSHGGGVDHHLGLLVHGLVLHLPRVDARFSANWRRRWPVGGHSWDHWGSGVPPLSPDIGRVQLWAD